MTRKFLTFAAFAVAALATPPARAADSLGEGWTWRRQITFRSTPSEAPGDNIAWVELYTNGDRKADASDIRITTADRYLVPHRVLQADAESDFVRVAFVTKTDGPYYIWWGNPKAEKPAKEADIRRGILVEVSQHAQGAPAAALNMPPAAPFASFIMPELNLGYNPAGGDDRQVTLHYTAQFKIERPVSVKLAFTVSDSGVLAIDGKEIDRQVRAGLKSQVRASVPLDLTTGWHTLDIKQVNQNQANVVMALVWQKTGEKTFTPLPAALFAPAARANAGPIEKVGAINMPNISVEPGGESFFPPSTYGQRYLFDVDFPPAWRPTITWSFGDGQTSTGLKKVSHIFLGPGHYPVSVKLEPSNGAAPATTTLCLAVRDRMYEKFPRPAEDNAATVRSVLKDYKPEKLPADQAFRGMMFFEDAAEKGSFGDIENQLLWGNAWLSAKENGTTLPDQTVFDEAFSLARQYAGRKDYKAEAKVYQQAAGKPVKLETRSNLMRLGVIALADDADDAAAAVEQAKNWLRDYGSNKTATQIAQTALGYALIASGDGKGSRAVLETADAMTPNPAPVRGRGEAYDPTQIRQGVLTRNVENYLRAKDFDTALTLLNQWELENPAAIWEGFTRTLRVKLAAAEGKNLIAARIALAHARANPDGFYAAELLYRAAENFKAADDAPRARTTLDLLATKYPESPYARDAAKSPAN